MKIRLKKFFNFLRKQGIKMVGPIEKKFKAIQMTVPDDLKGVLDLSVLPKYISYRAALLKEQVTLKFLIAVLTGLLIGQYVTSRFEISKLHVQLREKEYILAPGVLNFTPASAHSVSDQYIADAANDFLVTLGNVNPENIEEQYSRLSRFMSPSLKMRFHLDTADWIRQVKDEGISQILTILDQEITADDGGNYKVVGLGRAEFYSNHNYLGFEDQAFEMLLRLVPPENDRRWSLRIDSLQWDTAQTFRTKKKISKTVNP